MTDLTGKLIANTYKDLLTVNTSTTNTGLDNNLRKVQDGAGNNSSLKLSQTDAAFTGNVSVNGNLTVEGTFQPDTVNTNELQATRISATSITTNFLTAGTLIFQDVSVSSLRTGNLYAANISAGTVSATNINATNITVAGDSVATSSALASVNDALVSVEAVISSNIVFVLNAQASVLTILAGLSATDVNLQNNINSVSTTVSAVNVQVGINATQINTLSTSITANASAIVVNSDAITSINSVLAGGAFASASTSATLETRIAGVSSTMATSINNSNTAITNLSATLESRIAGVSSTMAASIASTSAALESHINTVSATLSIANVSIAANSSQIAAVSVLTQTNKDAVTSINAILGDGSAYASAGTSATLETRIAAVSATMATSINNSNSAIAALSATMATSINNSNTNIAAVSALTKTNLDAIASVNAVAIAAASAGTSATLQTKIAAVSATMATSINNSNTNITTNTQAITSINGVLGDGSAYASAGTSATLQTKIAAVSSTLATSIGNSNTNIAAVSVLTKTNKDAITSINGVLGDGSAYASAGTSATLETRIAAVSATMATSINNSNTNIAAVSVLTKTNKDAITSINAIAYASAGTSATLETRIAAVSSTMATSIGNSNSAITALSATMATSIATRLALAGGTMTGNLILNADPSANLQAASKQYVDNLTASSIHVHEAVRVETNGTNLNATYNNGSSGVGATLTNAGTQAALAIDGVTLNTSDRVLVMGQTNQTQNGVYVVTNTGSGSTNWILTRSDDADTSGDGDANSLDEGSYFFVQEGTVGAAHAFVCNTQGTITFGTTNITFAQFSDSVEYTAGTGININASRVISTSGVATTGQLTALSATMATSIGNSNTNIAAVSVLTKTNKDAITSINGVLGTGGAYASVGTSATLQTKINAVSATMATSINNSNTNITTNAAAITSINGVLGTGAFASAGTSATLQTKIATLSATMATSINNSNTNITTNANAITSINGVLGTGAFASAGTSATLQTKINAVSATMATSIGNSNTNITTNANAITSINGVLGTGAFASAGTSATLQTKIATLSATMATSINNSNTNITTNAAAITSINGVLGTGAFASAGTSATLETRIAAVSATMATSINNSNTNIAAVSVLTKTNKDAITSINAIAYASAGTSATLETRIAAVSATMATSISNYLPLAGGTVTGDVSFGDDDKAIFGAGSDLQIYHDGSNSYVKDAGTGDLYIQGTQLRLQSATGESFFVGVADGSAYVYHNGSAKLETTSTGIEVTGNVVSEVAINTQTGTTYTTVLADQSKLVTLNNGSAITLTIPANSSVAYPVGTKIDLAQLGAGQVTVAGAGGVTVNATPTLKLRAQYSAATCIKIATDTWLLVGDLAES
jgi:hypothetical protein